MSNLEKILQCISHLSQVGLLILAIFGYFYTVRPIYTKSILEEEIAKKQIEMKEKDKTISNINQEIATKKTEVEAVADNVTKLRGTLDETSTLYSRAKIKLDHTNKKLITVHKEYKNAASELSATRAKSSIYYNQLKVKAMEVLKRSTDCIGPISLMGVSEVKFVTPGECFEKAVKKKEFIEVSDLLDDSDKRWLLRSIADIGPRSKTEASKLVSDYKQTYAALKKEEDKFEKELASDAVDAGKTKNYEKWEKKLETKKQAIQSKTDNTIKLFDYEIEVVKSYNKLINEALGKIAQEFVSNRDAINLGDNIIKGDYP
jgi:chromosome segregation ATPase